MNSVLLVDLALFLFIAPHLLLGLPALRGYLVRRLGTEIFALVYSLAATVGLVLLAWVMADYGHAVPNAGALVANQPLRWLLICIMALGAFLVCAGLLHYPQSAIARLARRTRSDGTQNEPRSLPSRAAITYYVAHPFFLGLLLIMLGHAAITNHATMAVFFLGIALLTALGIPMQDAKLRKLHGSVYQQYLDSNGKDQEPPRQLSYWLLALGVTAAFIWAHPIVSYANGAGFVVLINLFGLGALVMQLLSTKKHGGEQASD